MYPKYRDSLFSHTHPLLGRLTQALLNLSHHSLRNLLGRRLATEILRHDSGLAHRFDNLHQLGRRLFLAEPGQHFGGCPEGRYGVGDALAGNVKGRAVDRLEHGGVLTGWVQVAGWGDADRAGEGGGQIREDIGMLDIC